MAGDWIKFESATSDKPEVWEIANQLNLDPDCVVGKLLRVWCWFDQQTEKGNAPSVTKSLLDRLVGVTGFCDCVIRCGWMLEKDQGIALPNFGRHNGQTAKNRALTAKRAANFKAKSNASSNDKVTMSALPKEEKRREEKRRENTKEILGDKPPSTQKRFVPPSLQEATEYFTERGCGDTTQPDRFINFYESKGWMVGKNKMKSWKASVRNWLKNPSTQSTDTPTQFGGHSEEIYNS